MAAMSLDRNRRLNQGDSSRMIEFLVLSGALFILLGVLVAIGRRKEVMDNWEKYRTNPLYLMTAFLYKPDDDPRSRFEFANDTFHDVMSAYSKDTLKSTMVPMASMMNVIGGSLGSSMRGMNNIDSILEIMMQSLDGILGVFEARYKSVLHRLKMTFAGLINAMNRTWGIAVNSLWQSIATIQAILSTVDLIIKIVIIILVILVAIIIFLFLFMWPVIPVILTVIGIIVSAGMGAAVGGMASAFCFAEDTMVEMNTGQVKPISEIKLGDVLAGGAITTAVMEFSYETAEMYSLHGISVSGSHIIYPGEDGLGEPIFVRDHPDAIRNFRWYEKPITLYCLSTTTHRIPIVSLNTNTAGHIIRKRILFSDWEELTEDDETVQLKWNRHVFETLNPGAEWDANSAEVRSEAVIQASIKVRTPSRGDLEISNIRPGMEVLDAVGQPTRVVGVVRTAWNQVKSTTAGGSISGAAWIRDDTNGIWKQMPTNSGPPSSKMPWYSLFTEAGTYMLKSGVGIRDFSDVGLDNISETYSWVLDVLKKHRLI
jgi:hypothetical protein